MSDALRSFLEMQQRVAYEARGLGPTGSIQNTVLGNEVRAALNEQYHRVCATFRFHELNTRYSVTLSNTAQTDADWPLLVPNGTAATLAAPADILVLRTAELKDTSQTPDVTSPIECMTHERFMRLTMGAPRASITQVPQWMALRRIEGVRELIANDAVIAMQVRAEGNENPAVQVSVMGFADAARTRQMVVTANVVNNTWASVATNLLPVGFSKASKSLNPVVLRKNTTNEELAVLMPWQRAAAYCVYEMYPFPNQNNVYVLIMDYIRRPPVMVNDSDYPWYAPPECHDLILEGAIARVLLALEDADWQSHQAVADRLEAKLLSSYQGDTLEETRIVLAGPESITSDAVRHF